MKLFRVQPNLYNRREYIYNLKLKLYLFAQQHYLYNIEIL